MAAITFRRMELPALKNLFEDTFHRPSTGAVRAPGRVNLIGEHTDYNGGFVTPIAIERETVALYAPRDDRKINFVSLQADAPASVDLDSEILPGDPQWGNYCKGVTAGLIERGVELVGADVLFDSDLPLGGGCSSSASLEVACAFALLGAARSLGSVPNCKLALLCQKAEHDFAGAPCGIMDQTIAIMGKPDHALLLDCRNGEIRQIPFDDPGIVPLVVDTQVRHDIADDGYVTRQQQCYSAARTLGVESLRDADQHMLDRLAGKELMRARHVVGEIRRTLEAADALERGDYERFGQLMYQSHYSLRDDYEVSCDELDIVVELARKCDGTFGARMTGGGFGGCAIVLVQSERADAIAKTIADGFERKFARRPPIFSTRAAGGASVLE